MQHRKSVVLIIVGAMLWGTTGTAQSFAPLASPIAIGAIRLAFGGLTLLVLLFVQRKLLISSKSIPYIIAASIAMAAYQPLFFSAVLQTGVAIGTVVAIGSAPVFSGILEWLIQKQMPEKKWWLSTGLSILGCALLVSNGDSIRVDLIGIVMAFGAGLSFAVYTLISKRLVRTYLPDTIVAVVFTLSALLLSPLLFFYDLSWLLEINGLLVALHLGILATGLAYLLYARGLVGVSSATAVTLSLTEPLTASLLGVLIVGEVLSLMSWIGIGLLFGGLTILSLPSKKQHRGSLSL
ncbi:EamA family transporter [Anaerobacillus sp. 1_MG-2023]|uniref:EamA family transporter n=1 Tax=Anaerobacillus sp. 1_MG-2023 TaxID=3062655 RepID=UPI0026E28175|nr:EamA family transporter [Anaerobacillus sp. 1_MG-2023]MDO6654709.1 EamA family transporter [Anaerobacillus sp. 1_MG-2023]